MRNSYLASILIASSVLGTTSLFAQLAVTDMRTNTPASLAQSLAGTGITVSNVQFSGGSIQAGRFTGGATATGIASGVILSTGDVNDARGPNSFSDTSTMLDLPGDSDLSGLAGGSTRDAAVLTFDFVPTQSSVSFRFVFASEEYNEYVGQNFNDVFAIYIDGANVALVPGTGTPIAINSINATLNSAYFRNNTNGTHDVEYDGLTTVLTATKTLTANTTHRIKFAIADVADGSHDSAVFIEASSLVAGTVVSVVASDADAAEAGANPGVFTLRRSGPTTAALPVSFLLSGTALNGSDYTVPASPVTIPAGQTEAPVRITPVDDSEVEGNQSVNLSLISGTGYQVGVPSSATVTIADNDTAQPPPTIAFVATSTVITAGGTSVLSWSVQNATTISINNGIGNVPASGSRQVSPAQTTTYTLTAVGSGGTRQAQATITVLPATPPPAITFSASPQSIVAGDSVTLEWAVTNANTAKIDPNVGTIELSQKRDVFPSQSTTYRLTATGPGGTSFKDVTVNVAAAPVTLQGSIQVDELEVAPGDNVTVSWATTGAASVSIDGLGPVPPTGSRTVVATTDAAYILRATSGAQTVTNTADLKVKRGSPPVIGSFAAQPESVAPGAEVRLTWVTGGALRAWINPELGTVPLNGNTIVRPTQTTLYTLKLLSEGGTTSKTLEVKVDGQQPVGVDTPAGKPGNPGSSDGQGGNAQFRDPSALGVDGTGTIYVVDAGNHTIRRIDATGKTETWAGQPGNRGSDNGYRTSARFDFSGFTGGFSVARDGSIKVKDTVAGVRIIDPNGNVSNCPANCGFLAFSGAVHDAAGNLYEVDAGTHTVRRKLRGSIMADFAGARGQAGFVDGNAKTARFNRPRGIALDQARNVYVGDSGNNAIRKISPTGEVTTIVGKTATGQNADVFSFGSSGGDLVLGGNGLLYVADPGSNTIKSVNPLNGEVRTVAGSGAPAAGDGSGAGASFKTPLGIAIDGGGDIVIADKGNHTVRRLDVNAGVPGGLPLIGGRFTVDVRYRNQFTSPATEGRLRGRSLYGSATSETAIFWFDDPDVVELMVRLSDARPFQNRIHLYYGGLSDVEFFITVSDSLTGKVVEYRKAPNSIAGGIDRVSFIADPNAPAQLNANDAVRANTWWGVTPNVDGSSMRMLGRYDVRIRYRNPFATPVTTGYLLARSIASSAKTETAVFYLSNPEAVEWMVRFSDARPFDDANHFFHGGLSDLEFTIEVTDTVTGVKREYQKAAFTLAGAVDRESFPTSGPPPPENRVRNGGFDSGLSSWSWDASRFEQGPGTIAWSQTDAAGNPRTTMLLTSTGTARAVQQAQCVPVSPNERYVFGGSMQSPAGQKGTAIIAAIEYGTTNCTGGEVGFSLREINTTSPVWTSIEQPTIAAATARSVYLLLGSVSDQAGATFSTRFDDIILRSRE